MKYKIIITAGGTSEKIDNVRRITNNSTGKLGATIADKLITLFDEKIEQIFFICPDNSCRPTANEKIKIVNIFGTDDLKETIENLLTKEKIDYFIHSMAVSDYNVDFVTSAEKLAKNISENPNEDILSLICNNKNIIKENKISSKEENLIIKLKKAPKIISLIKNLSPSTFLVGFKLLDNVSQDELINTAINLKNKNNCDLVVANDLRTIKDVKHKAFIINKNNEYIEAFDKEDIAIKLINEIFKDNA